MTTTAQAFAIICDDNFDAIWDTKAQADREAKDLRKMGHVVRIKAFATHADAEAYEDKLRGY
jgi:hypothetical protein